jgi:hypothetical protein
MQHRFDFLNKKIQKSIKKDQKSNQDGHGNMREGGTVQGDLPCCAVPRVARWCTMRQ